MKVLTKTTVRGAHGRIVCSYCMGTGIVAGCHVGEMCPNCRGTGTVVYFRWAIPTPFLQL